MSAFPISESTPVAHNASLPDKVDLVVIGGGVIGTCTALFAVRKGLHVALIEKGRIAGEQSSRNWGWIRQQGRDPHELPIMIEANRLWRDLAPLTNQDIGLQRVGVTYLARTDSEMADYALWLRIARAHDLDTELLDRAALARRFPELAGGSYAGALVTPSDMKAEPWVAVPALARIAAREGVHIVENCAARALDLSAGQVAGVVTEKGRIRTEQVVLAAGAWSSLFLRRHGVSLPQLSVRASVAATEPLIAPHGGAAADSDFAFRPRADGGLTLAPGGFHELFLGPDAFRALPKFLPQLKTDPFGTRYLPAAPRGYPDAWSTPRRWAEDTPSPFEAIRVLNPAPNRKKLDQVARAYTRLFPQAGPVRLRAAWAGMIDTLPDVVPVVDRTPLPGLIVATGMSGHGFGIGPGFGRVLADLVTGDDPGHDLSRFRFDRFTDGSKIDLGPAL
ncbi:FAD-binding oxidoreductase [Mesobacterium sp. TK19101]|uniref:FAD-binding oxidoreductase n=1 Tax=Mesobacterium hydrothermale TaxID=3111907 RepID=A0ABU6HL88_9RHOB|nr:FAD-binding oxidoreductase [Mesobacterium sp. TK19101]MEC3863222.1 FAD-binding oxidoreductase [Mesobacterium sp. TK19101]